ncbi:hypothetical protein A2Z00_02865 [Candidatus Gottesmanbacteria bacterium RBG_13_45_10]|uniref:Queuine tRNA-ribosyltransferase n=1 Tax=Candidatus Gottesmanbacteria bacterium RBG_13_45_10 TaxID=1798370 RepID=A0A1F5ZGL5_9BACT|nr:MAG: hypothetical protein A2Z00_02865 [Candidatus Gottesmanbacteria bacterium RBG_13_45_10]
MSKFKFELLHQDKTTQARVGKIHTPHGDIQTPAFVPVGTQATVKSLTPDELEALGVELFFVNTYHAYLRPGLEVIAKSGGLHKFMGWDKPLITDSGGFQVFSLAKKRYVNIAISESAVLDRETFTKNISKREAQKEHVYPDDYRPVGELVNIDDDGVTFTSHWDGLVHRFTPEVSIDIQHTLGADMIIAFDECAPYPTTQAYAQKAMERTHRWAVRSLNHHRSRQGAKQALYGVIQGSVFGDLRKESAKRICAMDFDGYAIGGVAVGESKKEMAKVLDWVGPFLPEEKPRHLLGVGEIDDIFTLVAQGIDTFDCVQPTRLARMGILLVKNKQINKSDPLRRSLSEASKSTNKKHQIDITKAQFALDSKPIEKGCPCYTCSHFSRAYLHHLFRVKELLGYRLATIHNISQVEMLVARIRESLIAGTFAELTKEWV